MAVGGGHGLLQAGIHVIDDLAAGRSLCHADCTQSTLDLDIGLTSESGEPATTANTTVSAATLRFACGVPAVPALPVRWSSLH